MSPREKNLLISFSAAGFLLVNFLGFKYFTDYRDTIDRERKKAQSELDVADRFLDSRDQVQGEMDWLAAHEPQPTTIQDAQTNLQQLAEKEARNRGLTIKSQTLLKGYTEGAYYHRAQVNFTVTGTEQALYGWIDRLHIPTEFRAVTSLELAPNKEDDTKIDAKLTIEQWFPPSDS